jgi:hypothetical protein
MTTRATFTEAEIARAARVANAERAVVRLERGGMVVEVKPVDVDRVAAQRPGDDFDLVDMGRR